MPASRRSATPGRGTELCREEAGTVLNEAAPHSLRAVNSHVVLLAKYARSKLQERHRRLKSDAVGLFREREYVLDHLRNDGVIQPLDAETARLVVWFIIAVVVFMKCRDTLERLSKSFALSRGV